MANWPALNWAESLTAGGPIVRAVLDKIALRVDDKYELYSSAPRIASLCELSPKPMRRALDTLESKGIITVIRRLRDNGAEATPVTLLNSPAAPHLNGKPVVLDFEGRFLYPQNPHALSEAGITWISANTLGRVHPKHQFNGGVVGETRGGWSERPGGVVGETTHGGGGKTTLNPLPRGNTQHHEPSAVAAGDGDGCSPTKEKRKDEGEQSAPEPGGGAHDETAGDIGGADLSNRDDVQERARVLLEALSMPHGPAFTVHASAVDAVAAKLEEHSESTITAALMDGIEAYKIPAAGVSTRLRELARLLADRQAQTAAQPVSGSPASIPLVCGHCEGREGDPVNGRLVFDGVHDTRGRWCPRCHPKGIKANGGRDEGQDVAGLAADAAAAIGLPA